MVSGSWYEARSEGEASSKCRNDGVCGDIADSWILGHWFANQEWVRWFWWPVRRLPAISLSISSFSGKQEHGPTTILRKWSGICRIFWFPYQHDRPKVNIYFWQQPKIQFETFILRTKKSIVMHLKSPIFKVFFLQPQTQRYIYLFIFSPILAISELYSIIRL